MSRRVSTAQGRRSRRLITFFWVAALSVLIITLLALEQTALLYVLATLGVTALLIVVAAADLSGARKALSGAPAPADDAAAIGTGIASTMPPAATASARPAPRAAKRR
jgi:peptidoglycan/LPS O-acetylase OafA/YrhL